MTDGHETNRLQRPTPSSVSPVLKELEMSQLEEEAAEEAEMCGNHGVPETSAKNISDQEVRLRHDQLNVAPYSLTLRS